MVGYTPGQINTLLTYHFTFRVLSAKKLALEHAMRNWIALFLLGTVVTPALADVSASSSASSNGTVYHYDRRDIALP